MHRLFLPKDWSLSIITVAACGYADSSVLRKQNEKNAARFFCSRAQGGLLSKKAFVHDQGTAARINTVSPGRFLLSFFEKQDTKRAK